MSAMIPAKMKSRSTLKTWTRMNAAPSKIQMIARMMASHTSAFADRVSHSGRAALRALLDRDGLDAVRSFAERPPLAEDDAARLAGAVAKADYAIIQDDSLSVSYDQTPPLGVGLSRAWVI
jgi:ABC-type phosphate/phosphonate transport system substrate-binding protein